MTTFDKEAVFVADNHVNQKKLSQRDELLKEKLLFVMTNEQAFKESRLTIITLASKLAVSQHRLRSLINQSLGHKNFSEFVNAYRIKDVKMALVDPQKAHIPILTLALDGGFKSLSSFNRAFKKVEDVTPSHYRKKGIK